MCIWFLYKILWGGTHSNKILDTNWMNNMLNM